MFDFYWTDMSNNSILDYETAKMLYDLMMICVVLEGSTAEVGVYEGITSKLIRNVLNKTHFCYDTFEGILGSSSLCGDKHSNGEFVCHLDKVKQNINSDNVFYKQGWFPDTFEEDALSFCFVYSDTATYLGVKHTFDCFKPSMVSGGKIIFYVDNNCSGVQNAINEFQYENAFIMSHTKNFVIFTKK